MKRYFESLAKRLTDSENLVLYGPAETAQRFKRFLDERHPQIAGRVRDVLPADSMTENQMKALVRDYFKS